MEQFWSAFGPLLVLALFIAVVLIVIRGKLSPIELLRVQHDFSTSYRAVEIHDLTGNLLAIFRCYEDERGYLNGQIRVEHTRVFDGVRAANLFVDGECVADLSVNTHSWSDFTWVIQRVNDWLQMHPDRLRPSDFVPPFETVP